MKIKVQSPTIVVLGPKNPNMSASYNGSTYDTFPGTIILNRYCTINNQTPLYYSNANCWYSIIQALSLVCMYCSCNLNKTKGDRKVHDQVEECTKEATQFLQNQTVRIY